LNLASSRKPSEASAATRALPVGGLAGWLGEWLRDRLRPRPHREPRLALLERIALAPRQSLALVEAEGRRLLVVTSAEGGSAIYPLDDARPAARRVHEVSHPDRRFPRVSW
jgi:hypothetical protein